MKSSKFQSDDGPSTFTADSDTESKAETITLLPAPTLKYKRLDYYYSKWGKSWKYRVRFFAVHIMLHMAQISAEHEFEGHCRDASESESRKWRSLERILLCVSFSTV